MKKPYTITTLSFDEDKGVFNLPIVPIRKMMYSLAKEEYADMNLEIGKDVNSLERSGWTTGHILNGILFFDNTFYVLLKNKTCIGMVLTRPKDELYIACREFASMYIMPKYRGQGLGSEFSNEVFELEKKEYPKLKKLLLNTRNQKLIDWYAKSGFVTRYTEMTKEM